MNLPLGNCNRVVRILNLILKNGVLFYVWADHDNRCQCLVVPTELRMRVLYHCHNATEAGHLGNAKTLDRLKQRFYWYGMSKDSNLYVKQCSTSNQVKKSNRTPRSALGTYPAGFPMERIHLDILGPINPRSRSGSSYVLVMVDQFTKWVELAALPAQNAELTAKAFLKHFVVTFGCTLEVHTDQGKNFISDLFLAFCKLMEITRLGLHLTTLQEMASVRFLIEPSCKWSVPTSPEVRNIEMSTFPLSLWYYIR